MKKTLTYIGLSIVCLFFSLNSHSQSPTLGLLYNGAGVSDGYILFSPESSNDAYLINNCGEVIRKWSFNEGPGATCYLLANGSLLRAGTDSLTIHDWDDNLVWSFGITAILNLYQNHDIEPLPNGNVLCIVSRIYPAAVIIAQGRNPAIIGTSFKIENIIEIQPVGLHDGLVAWQWILKDHLIQDFDSTKLNYGVVEDHPELFDINYDAGLLPDWSHTNAVEYNAELDQILVSSRHLNEIYIIDHSTTTAQAAGHTGGNSGKGGDLLWRWGNPFAYRQGTNADQKLFMQHDAKWVEAGYPDFGKISVFNNGGVAQATSVGILTPSFSGGAYQLSNNRFLPDDFDWTWEGDILGHTVLESKKGGMQTQQNGNVLITESSLGQVSEITKAGNLVWSYKNPVGPAIYNQFDIITAEDNTLYKAEKYPSDFAGFVGKDMTPIGIIEDQNANSDTCINLTGAINIKYYDPTIENPVVNGKIIFNRNVNYKSVSITDINGKQVFSKNDFNGNSLDTDLKPAVYFLQLDSGKKTTNLKIIVQ